MSKVIRTGMIAVLSAVMLLLAACQAAKPKPKPAPAPAPVIQNTHETLSADALFAFGKSEIRSMTDQGRSQMDELVAKLGTGKINSVGLVGYTDRIGDKTYNENLSLRRANAVRDYLVHRGVDARLVKTEGRGESSPVAACPKLLGKKLRECLAPNRRVEVNISAVR
ncbi:MAG TPA: OmpA family protein [Rhodanobacter sp.]